MIRIIITGAAGRMGRHLVANIAASDDLQLTGATEYPGSEFQGIDAGSVAGVKPLGVKITPELAPLLDNADAVIDFSTGDVIGNAHMAAAKGLAIVIGTTALTGTTKRNSTGSPTTAHGSSRPPISVWESTCCST